MAKWVITHRHLFQIHVEEIKKTREAFRLYLEKIGCKAYPSNTNFLWVESLYPLDVLLKEEQVYIKQLLYKEKIYYRISIGTPEEMERVKEVLELKVKGELNEAE
ncbi:MAG: aminotransferase class I/II-fold pyridoxal phosphate-dependent enzyme [Candidatus Niameybacter stercoravium]|nr:aminotransferase class I/II-fold pyridoxal phosphate-dependent enzyme [Candidatus Niameybacter stercoravium]